MKKLKYMYSLFDKLLQANVNKRMVLNKDV